MKDCRKVLCVDKYQGSTLFSLDKIGRTASSANDLVRAFNCTSGYVEDMEEEIKELAMGNPPHCHSDPDVPTQTSEPVRPEQDKIAKRYIGHQDIVFDQLEPAEGRYVEFRVREVDETRVHTLVETFRSKSKAILSSQLTVMRIDSDHYVVLDGNHRYRAMCHLRNELGKDWYDTVSCRVYETLSAPQALGVGYSCNQTAENVLRMSDWAKVSTIRKILEEPSETQKDPLIKVYDLLHVTEVSNIINFSVD